MSLNELFKRSKSFLAEYGFSHLNVFDHGQFAKSIEQLMECSLVKTTVVQHNLGDGIWLNLKSILECDEVTVF